MLHHACILLEGNVLGYHRLHVVGIVVGQSLQGLEHDVGTLVCTALALDAYKEADGVVGRPWLAVGGHGHGKGNETHLLGQSEVPGVGCMVLIEARHDALAVEGHHLVEPSLVAIQPFADEAVVVGIGAQAGAQVEVAVFKGGAVHSRLHPVAVHAVGSHEDASVLAFQLFVEGQNACGFQFQEYGVDELHHIVAFQPFQHVLQVYQIADGVAESGRLTGDVHVAGIVFPSVTVRHHCHLVAQLPQSFGQRPVYIAIFSYQ